MSIRRLSSNSSGGATVYYSGTTLSNTVGDQIDDIGSITSGGYLSHPGQEQFGLAVDSTTDTHDAAFNALVSGQPTVYANPSILPLIAETDYAGGAGGINSSDPGGITAKFAFTSTSSATPVPVANETTGVLHCATGKMRYVANIAPDTPAGIYTTKINYLAAPQY